jgi:hypothetical protein
LVLIILGVHLAACGDGVSDPVLSAGDVEGEWTLVLHEEAPGCVPERGSVGVLMTAEHVLTDILNGDLYLTGRWEPEGGEAWSVASGRFHARDGTFELTLHGSPVMEDGPRITVAGAFDTRAGMMDGHWSEVGGDVLYEGGCSGWLTGERH